MPFLARISANIVLAPLNIILDCCDAKVSLTVTVIFKPPSDSRTYPSSKTMDGNTPTIIWFASIFPSASLSPFNAVNASFPRSMNASLVGANTVYSPSVPASPIKSINSCKIVNSTTKLSPSANTSTPKNPGERTVSTLCNAPLDAKMSASIILEPITVRLLVSVMPLFKTVALIFSEFNISNICPSTKSVDKTRFWSSVGKVIWKARRFCKCNIQLGVNNVAKNVWSIAAKASLFGAKAVKLQVVHSIPTSSAVSNAAAIVVRSESDSIMSSRLGKDWSSRAIGIVSRRYLAPQELVNRVIIVAAVVHDREKCNSVRRTIVVRSKKFFFAAIMELV